MHNPDFSTVTAIIAADPSAMAALAAVRARALPDGWIGAGFVRNKVWDRLSGISPPRPLADIDVVYFDPSDPEGDRETQYESLLQGAIAGPQWQVRNQARMHRRHGDAPYRNTEEAISRWLETPTAVAVRLDTADRIGLLAPYGVADLLSLTCRPTAAGSERPDQYRARVVGKGWQQRWPGLRVLYE